MTRFVPSDEFKAQCLAWLNKVHKTKKKIVITKQNKPIAELVPMEENSESLFGKMKGTIQIVGNIVSPIENLNES